MVHITLPEVFDANFYRLIPSQRMTVNRLLDKNIILSYSLDMKRKNVWMFMRAKTELEVMDIVSTFPILHRVKVSINELAFYDTAPVNLPEIVLN